MLLKPGPHLDAAMTGLGDTFIAGYALQLAGRRYSLVDGWKERHDIVAEAVQTAGLVCTLKILKALLGGRGGIEGAPTLREWNPIFRGEVEQEGFAAYADQARAEQYDIRIFVPEITILERW